MSKPTVSTLKGMLTRRDKKIAVLTNRNADLHAQLADAVRLAKQVARENAVLRNNMEVLQRPHRVAKRNELSRCAFDALDRVKELSGKLNDALDWYENEKRGIARRQPAKDTSSC